MTDLKEAIAAVDARLEQKDYPPEAGELASLLSLLVQAAESHLAAQEDEEATPASQWIPVEDGLPEETWKRLLVTVEGFTVPFGAFIDDRACWRYQNSANIRDRVLAWANMPAPYQPPKPINPYTVMRKALEKISESRAKSGELVRCQRIARAALDKVKGEA